MKSIIYLLVFVLVQYSYAQNNPTTTNPKTTDSVKPSAVIEKKITTLSSKVEDVFDVIIDEILMKTTKPKNVIFLVEITSEEALKENKVLLKQGIKVLTKKLSEKDRIAIVTYGRSNKVISDYKMAIDKKGLVDAVLSLKVDHMNTDLKGIDLGYSLAEKEYNVKGENIVVLLRDDTEIHIADVADIATDQLSLQQAQIKKQKNTTILITALSLIPDIIRIIK